MEEELEKEKNSSRAIYVDNQKLYDIMSKYIEMKNEALKKGVDPPKIPDEIGFAILQIANRLSTRYNFNGYTYKDEMISDGVLNAIQAVDSFDPTKSKNPFSYFTQVIFNAFIRRIEREKREKDMINAMMLDTEYRAYSVQEEDADFELRKDDLVLYRSNIL